MDESLLDIPICFDPRPNVGDNLHKERAKQSPPNQSVARSIIKKYRPLLGVSNSITVFVYPFDQKTRRTGDHFVAIHIHS